MAKTVQQTPIPSFLFTASVRMPESHSDLHADSHIDDVDLARAVDITSLYEKYSRRSLAFLASMGVRHADAEDVAQKAWLRVFQSLNKKPFEGHFRGWLFQILRNTAIDAMRKKRPEAWDEATAESATDDIAAPDQSLLDAEYSVVLKGCLETLEPDTRKIVSGRLAGDSYEAVANALNVQTARAHRLFFDAKKALAACLQQKGFGTAS